MANPETKETTNGHEMEGDDLGDAPEESLQDQLNSMKEKFQGLTPPDIQEFVQQDFKAWKESDMLELALKEGEIAPDFALPDQDGNVVSSVDLRSKGPVVIIFFRGDWCGFCNTTLRMIRKYTPHIKARGASLVAISPQTVTQSYNTKKSGDLNFTLLSDIGSEYAQLLNIAFVMSDKIKGLYEANGINFGEYNDDDSGVLPLPATYVIEQDGRVTYSHVETDYTVRAEPVDILNALPPLRRKRRYSLTDKIEIEYAKIQDKTSDSVLQNFRSAVSRAQNSGFESNALKVGVKAPDFKLSNAEGSMVVDSKKLRKQGPLVVIFNYGHKSPLCLVQLESMQQQLSKFEAKNATVLAISPAMSDSSSFSVTSYNESSNITQLLDNDKGSVAKSFGLLYDLPGSIVGRGEAPVSVPMAATYVIDRSGLILYSHVSADPIKRPEPSRILENIPSSYQRRAEVKRGPFSLLFGGRLAPKLRKRLRGE